ncbi:MAG: pyridoxal phosphate-dependent aminotransferase, partial [Planctomycetota bacterium]
MSGDGQGDDIAVAYMHWAKTHSKVRYELTGSGVPDAAPTDIAVRLTSPVLEVRGPYGDLELIDAVAKRYSVSPDGIVPVTGASSGIFIALGMSVLRGGSVIVEHPAYDPLMGVAAFLGLKVTRLVRRADSAFAVASEHLDAGLSQGASAVVLTNLHNPSGQCLSKPDLRGIAKRCTALGATLIVDEVYLDGAHLISGRPLWTAAELGGNVIAINSLTKVYGLGGLRVGWLITGPELATRARTMIDLLNVDNSAPSSALALQAFAHIAHLEERYRRFHREGQAVYRRWLSEESLVEGYANHGAV